MRHDRIHLIAQTLAECDGADWQRITPAQRDRYVRIAILVDHRLGDEAAGRTPLSRHEIQSPFPVGDEPGRVAMA